MFITKDGFKWNIKTEQEAEELFNSGSELYIVNKREETERLVSTKEDFNDIDEKEEFYAQEYV